MELLSRCPEKFHCPVPLETLLWAEPAILGSTKTALKIKYEIKIGSNVVHNLNRMQLVMLVSFLLSWD